jgi:molybdopterin synthase sulfur carrier subunit
MHITVKLYLAFRTGRFQSRAVDYPDGVTIKQVADALDLRDVDIGTAIRNGREAELDQALSDGDTLQLFPLVGGG